ncbi:MAG: methylenetetrahydrofolate reductase [Pseudomonadota bacterium]
MSKIIDLFSRKTNSAPTNADEDITQFLEGFSIEVMPRTAAKVESFREILPEGTRVYIAHIEGTPIEDMVATAKRLADEGFPVMPHFPARGITSRAQLAEWISMYRGEAGVEQALLLAGGYDQPTGAFDNSMELMETGLFADFKRLHVGGHPEGNKDIDPDGSKTNVSAALRWKQSFSENTDAEMAIATQFLFEAETAISWADSLKAEGISMPVHIGIAGPAKLQTMIKFAMACGVGPSLRVLQRRAADVSKLLLPFEPTDILRDLAKHKAAHPDFNIAQVHFFPLGGIKKTAEFVDQYGRPAGSTAAAIA